ncbi:hypothetical protein D3C86_1548300 [compost metagenome]
MRQEAEFLEHHRRFVTAEFPQRRSAHAANVLAVVENLTCGRVDQPVDVADQRRLAGTGKPHDHHHAAGRHRDVDVLQAEHVAVFFVEFRLAQAPLDRIDIVAAVGAEDLVEVLHLDRVTSHG